MIADVIEGTVTIGTPANIYHSIFPNAPPALTIINNYAYPYDTFDSLIQFINVHSPLPGGGESDSE